MVRRILPAAFYIGISFLIVGALFKIQHWPGSANLFTIGVSLQLVCFIALAVEVFSSRKAKIKTKLLWGLPALALIIVMALALSGLYVTSLPIMVPVFIIGGLYNKNGRKIFLYKR